MLVFYTGQSPLSNFYIVVKVQTFNCIEKFCVKSKSDFVDDPVAQAEVLTANTHQECHKVSQKLNKEINMKQWMEAAHKVMFAGVKAKFSQSDYLKKYLLNTEFLTLVEANSSDIHWSCRLTMKDHEKLIDTKNCPGQNQLSTILMEVRSTLHA